MIRHEPAADAGHVPRLIVEAAAMNLENARALLEAGRPFLDGEEKVIDLAAVKEVDSAAIAVFLEWQRENFALAHARAKAEGDSPAQEKMGKLSLSGAPASLVSLSELYSLQDRLARRLTKQIFTP